MKTATIIIPANEVNILQNFLNMRDSGSDEIVQTFTADFGDGYEADIKVCGGDPPYVDPVLFLDGQEILTIEVSDSLLGEYLFEHPDVGQFQVIVRQQES